MKATPVGGWLFAIVGAFVGVCVSRGEAAQFLMNGPINNSGTPESYVVSVEDEAMVAEARAFLANPPADIILVPVIRVAAGGASQNLNYAEPGHPAWSWHVVELVEWVEVDQQLGGATVFIPEHHSSPSQVPALIAADHEQLTLVHYPLAMELQPGAASKVVNLSTRGWVDAGERILIGGFIVEGGEPRNLLIRALGPTLAPFGVQEPLIDPLLILFRGQTELARNDSWRASFLGQFFEPTYALPLPPEYSWMVPGNDNEAVLWVSLPPGAYTVHVRAPEDMAGVGLLEIYDRDALAADAN